MPRGWRNWRHICTKAKGDLTVKTGSPGAFNFNPAFYTVFLECGSAFLRIAQHLGKTGNPGA
jgi:hypothetical protein